MRRILNMCSCFKSPGSSRGNQPQIAVDEMPGSDNDDDHFQSIIDADADAPSTSAVRPPHIWSRDLSDHFLGSYSFAVVQANQPIEDQSQVEVCPFGTFVGIYDGHAGAVCSNFVKDNLFENLTNAMNRVRLMHSQAIRFAIGKTEDQFKRLVVEQYDSIENTLIATQGTCCLVGVIWKDKLHIANLGDSRAVLGSMNETGEIVAQQLTVEHNVSRKEIREELEASHSDVDNIVVHARGSWRVKGLIQVSRTIGDVYLKDPRYKVSEAHERFIPLGDPIRRAVLSASPSLLTRDLVPNDRFIIFASDGLWEHFSNEEAVSFVQNHPREGIAKRLIHKALRRSARNRGRTYELVKNASAGQGRRRYHDDITVVVIFLDEGMLEQNWNQDTAALSVKGYSDSVAESSFLNIRQIQSIKNLTATSRAPDIAESSSRQSEGPGTPAEDIIPECSSSKAPIQKPGGPYEDIPECSSSKAPSQQHGGPSEHIPELSSPMAPELSEDIHEPSSPTTPSQQPGELSENIPEPSSPTAPSQQPGELSEDVPEPSSPKAPSQQPGELSEDVPEPSNPTAPSQQPGELSEDVPEPSSPTAPSQQPGELSVDVPEPSSPTAPSQQPGELSEDVPEPCSPTAPSQQPGGSSEDIPELSSSETSSQQPEGPHLG